MPHISLTKSGDTTELGKTSTNKRTYVIRDFGAKDAGTYVCRVRNDYGDSSEETTSITMLGNISNIKNIFIGAHFNENWS